MEKYKIVELASLYGYKTQEETTKAIEFTLELIEEIQLTTDEDQQPIAYSKQKTTLETLHRLRHELF